VKGSQKRKVIGIGLNRTGTTTLGLCLQNFGYRHTSVNEQAFSFFRQGNMDAVMQMVSMYDSFDDWPWPLVYRQIDQRYPDSRFILTKRATPAKWIESISRLAALTGPTEFRRVIYGHGVPQGNESDYLAVYNRHNAEVEKYFSDRPDKLLIVCWEKGDGWDELCDFLGLPVPASPFPHVNRSDRLEQIVRAQRHSDQ